MIAPVSLKDWERDVINRQRNIVFPDTMLNQGRFYRNLASGKAVFTSGQRLSLLAMVCFFILVNAIEFADWLGRFVAGSRTSFAAWAVEPAILSLIWLLFWLFLAIKAFFPDPEPPRRRRRGYRRSSLE